MHSSSGLRTGLEYIKTQKEKHTREMDVVRKEERIDYVERENREPGKHPLLMPLHIRVITPHVAMAKWKKRPFEKREYMYIEGMFISPRV